MLIWVGAFAMMSLVPFADAVCTDDSYSLKCAESLWNNQSVLTAGILVT